MFRRIVFSASLAGLVAGIALTAIQQLVAMTHLIGTPHPETRSALAPPELARTFIVATAVTNAAFRMVLRAGCAAACRKLA